MADEKPIDAEQMATGDAQASAATTDSAAGQVEAGDAQAESKTERTDWKGLYLSNKSAAEEANRLRKELAETQARLYQPPTQTVQDPAFQAQAAWQQTIEELQALAPKDPASRAILAKMQNDDREMRQLRAEMELARLPETEREGTIKYLQTGDFRTVAAARKAMLGDQSETREKERLESERKQKELDAARKAKASAPDTTIRTAVTSTPGTGSMKHSEWMASYAAAKARGDRDEMARLRSPAVERTIVPG